MTAYTKLVEKDKSLKGLAAYSASRPQHSEGLAVFIAATWPTRPRCPTSTCCT